MLCLNVAKTQAMILGLALPRYQTNSSGINLMEETKDHALVIAESLKSDGTVKCLKSVGTIELHYSTKTREHSGF